MNYKKKKKKISTDKLFITDAIFNKTNCMEYVFNKKKWFQGNLKLILEMLPWLFLFILLTG